ncbi:hypothetical protein F5Y11DRAFT_306913 [Daldinia sp. FL1419]|nr:hypothetical protein F5Y11DRAFT_306913 [Daldinia sp. FL1419]
MLPGLPYLSPECDSGPVGAYIHKGCRFASLTRPIFPRGRISISHLRILQDMGYPQLARWYWFLLLDFLLGISTVSGSHCSIPPLPVPSSSYKTVSRIHAGAGLYFRYQDMNSGRPITSFVFYLQPRAFNSILLPFFLEAYCTAYVAYIILTRYLPRP